MKRIKNIIKHISRISLINAVFAACLLLAAFGVGVYSLVRPPKHQGRVLSEATATADRRPPALSTLNDIKSITFHVPNQSTSQALDQLVRDLPKIKAAGYNTIWFVSWWPTFEPQPLANPPVYNNQSFEQLRQTLDMLRANNMRAIVGLNYIGDQRNSDAPRVPEFNIDRCQWLKNPLMYKAFEDYVTRFLTEISDYNDMVYLNLFTEGTWNGYYCSRNYDGHDLALKLQSSLGSLPTRLPPELRKKFLIGLHDGFLINYDQTDIPPTSSPMPFDFVSMVTYDVDKFPVNQQIRDWIDATAARFKKFYPDTPLMIGETGGSDCADNQVENQIRANGEVIRYALQKHFGFNLWDWQGQSFCPDGRPTKFLGVVRNYIRGVTVPAPEILVRDDGLRIRGVSRNGFEWLHYLQANYNGTWYDGRDQEMYDLQADPFELNNIMKRQGPSDNPLTRALTNPAYGPIIRSLRKELAIWQTDTKDTVRRQITSEVAINLASPTTLRLSWTSDWYATSEIEYKESNCPTCASQEVNDFNFVTDHKIDLNNLKANTAYDIRVFSIGDNGNGAYKDTKAPGGKIVNPPTAPPAEQIPPASSASISTITIRAKGTLAGGAYPAMDLRLGDRTLQNWTVTGDYQDYTTTTSEDLTKDPLRVVFTNDYFSCHGFGLLRTCDDRNLTVDRITVNGQTSESEDPKTYVSGFWSEATGCAAGNYQAETIFCNNGYFEYPTK